MRRLRAIVNIHAVAPTLPGSNSFALDQTASRASCASSSALCSLAPDRRMKVFIRGAKYSNNVANASRSPRAATASIRAGHLAASDVAPLGFPFNMPHERSQPPTNVRREYRIARDLARAPIRRGNRASICIAVKRRASQFGSPSVIQTGIQLVLINGPTCKPGPELAQLLEASWREMVFD